MALRVTNKTHWNTLDIKRIFREAMRAASYAEPIDVHVLYHTRNVTPRKKTVNRKRVTNSAVEFCWSIITESPLSFTLYLPKVGPKELHPNPMVAIACAVLIPTDKVTLAPAETFRLANGLASVLFHARTDYFVHCDNEADERLGDLLSENAKSDMSPSWAKPENLLIRKVKDPKQDGTYLDFIAKKEALLKRTETVIRTQLAKIKEAEQRLAKAEKRKRAIVKSIQDAKARRT